MLTKSSDLHHTISKKSSLRPKTGLRIKTKNPQEFAIKDMPETQTPTIAYVKSTSKPSSPRSVLSPQMQRISSPLFIKSQLFFKRSASPKEMSIGEKQAASVFKLKAAPKRQEYGSSSPSEEGKRMIDLRNNQIQIQPNNFTQEIEKFEQIRKIKEPQIPIAVFTSPHGSKRGSLNEPQANDAFSLQKLATEGEEFPAPHHLAQSSGFDFSTVSFVRDRQKSASMVLRGGGIARRFVSPTAQEYKLSSNFKTPIVEENHLLFTEGVENENQANEKGIKKNNHPVSQAMFRMREFKKAKSIVMKKNKRKLSITTETTNTNSFASKIPSPRPLESPFAKTRPLFSPQGKTKFVFDKPFVENTTSQIDIHNLAPEFVRNRSETIQNLLNTEKTMTILPDEGLTIRITKSLEGQAPAQGSLPLEDENQLMTWHFVPKPKAPINSLPNDFRRKSELETSNKIEKYSMKRFLKLNEGNNNSYNSIESATLPKVSEMKDQKNVKSPNSYRKPTLDIDISLANSEDKSKRASPKSVTVNLSSPHRKSIFKPPITITSVQPELQQKQSPKFSPLLKPLESPHLRASKSGERNQNNVIRRKKSGNPLEEIDELSQISIKQSEVNDSFELDNFDFIRKTSIKLKQV